MSARVVHVALVPTQLLGHDALDLDLEPGYVGPLSVGDHHEGDPRADARERSAAEHQAGGQAALRS